MVIKTMKALAGDFILGDKNMMAIPPIISPTPSKIKTMKDR